MKKSFIFTDLEKLNSIQQFQDFVKKYKAQGYEISIKDIPNLKTLQQLRFVYGVVFKAISRASGYSVREVKRMMKNLFLRETIDNKKETKKRFFHNLKIGGHSLWIESDKTLAEIAEIFDPSVSVTIIEQDKESFNVKSLADVSIDEMKDFINQCLVILEKVGGHLDSVDYKRYQDYLQIYTRDLTDVEIQNLCD